MIKKSFLNNKATLVSLYVIYILMNVILSIIFFKSSVAKKIYSISGVNSILDNTSILILVLMVVFMALFTAIFMTFIYRNLLKFIFIEHNTWKTIDFCYLVSVILGDIVAIFILLAQKDIEIESLGTFTNITTCISINVLFYLTNKKIKDQLVVLVISMINASIIFLL
ncbi:hypothetical protein ACFJXP_11145 [Enterococcus faecalis]